jgi:hypothetical protein
MVNPEIHIFSCGDELGFSLRKSGDDLPRRHSRRWIRLRSAELDSGLLGQLTVDPKVVLRDIVEKGHHVTTQLRQPVLPSAHRQSA